MTNLQKWTVAQLFVATILPSCTSDRLPDTEISENGGISLTLDMSRSMGNFYPENLTVLAFKGDGKGNFVFQNSTEIMSDNSVITQNEEGKWVWKNEKFFLPIGEYRLMVVYSENPAALKLDYPKDANSYTWDELTELVNIRVQKDAKLNVGEVFANDPDNEVFVNGMQGNIGVRLERVSTRLDFRFIKIDAETGEEQDYTTNNIFGGTLASVQLEANVPSFWGWYSDVQDNRFMSWTDLNVDGSENSNVSIDDKGFAYYEGAYILPFADENVKLDNLEIELTSQNYNGKKVKYRIEDVPARKNHISLVTVRLLAEGEKDDNENIFTEETNLNTDVDVSVMDRWPEYNEDAEGDDGFWTSCRISSKSMDVSTAQSQLFRVYVFKASKIGNEDPQSLDDRLYKFESKTDLLSYDALNSYKFTIEDENAGKYHYKLVITSTPADEQEVTTNIAYSQSPDVSLDTFQFIRMKDKETGAYIPLSKDNYIASAYVTQESIDSRNLEFVMKRITGELVFDFGRYSKDSGKLINLDKGYNTVFDGIYKVRTEILNTGEVLDYEIDGTTNDTRLPGSLQSNPWNYETNSMVRLYGPFMMPENNVKLKLTFYYYSDVTIGEEPFTETLILNMPSDGKNISVLANSYTVSTVKIVENRIIDTLKTWGDVEIDTEWK